ncbi:MAG TPA: amidohydrolase family protein [Vicinamibacterales bacterium]|nr:amidohydrolase family protein [Vicinamibacterales bacterium]
MNPLRNSRRDFLATSGAALAAGFLSSATGCSSPVEGQGAGRATRLLLKGGVVLSLDAKVGDFEAADVLIEGARIAEVRPNITTNAEVVDASNMIVMPGFVDTHRHMWQGALRNILPNGLLSDYTRDITGTARALFRPEDVHIGDLVTALGALNAGVTTILDWSHIGNSPEHTDAAIAGLRESGIRAVYAFGAGSGPKSQYPGDIRRLRKQHFSSPDQLLTLALATGQSASDWALARDVGAFVSLHVNGALGVARSAMGPDVTYIHCTGLTADNWKAIADSGGHVSLASPIEMEMGHGVPPIQEALDHGVRPSLSVDVETQMPGELFTQMRTVFTLQRMQAIGRERAGEAKPPRLLTTREVVEFATLAGARANRLDQKIGTLTPGKEADVVLLRRDLINVLPLNNVYGAIVQAMDTSNVDTVIVAGQVRKRAGQLVGVDLARVRQQAEQSRDYIVSKAGWPKTVFGGYLPGH